MKRKDLVGIESNLCPGEIDGALEKSKSYTYIKMR